MAEPIELDPWEEGKEDPRERQAEQDAQDREETRRTDEILQYDESNTSPTEV